MKQILLNRMAELEALSAMEPTEIESATSSPSDLPSLAIGEDGVKKAVDTPLEKLD